MVYIGDIFTAFIGKSSCPRAFFRHIYPAVWALLLPSIAAKVPLYIIPL